MSISNNRFIATITLILIDLAMIFCAFYLATYIVYNNFATGSVLGFFLIELSIIMSVYLFGGYALRRQLSYWHIPGQMAIAVVFALVGIATLGYISKLTETDLNFWRTQLMVGMLLVYIWLFVSRFVVRFSLQKLTAEPKWMILGSIEQAAIVEKEMYEVYGEGVFEYKESLSGIDDEVILNAKIDGLIVMPNILAAGVENQLLDLRFRGVRVFNVSEFYERYLSKVPLQFLDRTWFATSAEYGLLNQETPLRLKRLVDLIISAFILLLAAPIMVLAAIAIYLQDRNDVFYSQIRTGVGDQPFKILKFRTMIQNAEQEGQPQWAAENDSRITPLGKFLRLTRIDELPQLWNVFRGEMSFIGPRPERPEFVSELEKNIPLFQYRHAVKPGITGWAQVMYRYGASEEDAEKKLEYDLYYIRNYSLMLDLFIVLRTCRVVLFGMGR
jgi:exopolysaccharide biosynthesis polyprenyl glycosylphosphotransferase